MSPGFKYYIWNDTCFPRVSGDEPTFVPGEIARAEFSPRERG